MIRTISQGNFGLISVTDGNYEVVSINIADDSSIAMEVMEVDSYRNNIGEKMTFEFLDVKGKAVATSENLYTSVLWFSEPDNKYVLPASDRLRIYEIAFERYKNCKNKSAFGMCLHMEEAIKQLFPLAEQCKLSAYYYPHIYPEFIECKPCSVSPIGYWWPLALVEQRSEAFEQMISSVKEKITEEGRNNVSI
jgi:hypothetical protein